MNFKVINKKNAFSIAAASFLMLSACTPMQATHGNLLEETRLSQITTGTSTRDDVFRALGSPTTVSPFDNNTWYYMGQKTEKRGIFDAEVVDEKIVIVKFDDNNIVSLFEEMDDSRQDIPISSQKTPTYGNDVSAVQQLLGNLGKFNPRPVE